MPREEEATKFQRKCTKEGAGVHSGVNSVLQVLVYLEAPTMIFFAVIILSMIIRGHTGQGRTVIWMTGVFIKGYKGTATEKTSMTPWDPLMISGLLS